MKIKLNNISDMSLTIFIYSDKEDLIIVPYVSDLVEKV